jgi:hypothetical protein
MGVWIALLAMAAVAWWVWDGSQARERAVVAARRACERHDQQLLDETVQQLRVEWRRTASGSLLPKRVYRFEFTADGDVRYSGQLAIHGNRIVALHLDLPDYTLIEGSAVSSESKQTLH